MSGGAHSKNNNYLFDILASLTNLYISYYFMIYYSMLVPPQRATEKCTAAIISLMIDKYESAIKKTVRIFLGDATLYRQVVVHFSAVL